MDARVAQMTWSKNRCRIQLANEQGDIFLVNQFSEIPTTSPTLYLYIKEGQLIAINQKKIRKSYDRIICLQPDESVAPEQLQHYLIQYATDKGFLVTKNQIEESSEASKEVKDYAEIVWQLVAWFGYEFVSHETSLKKEREPHQKKAKKAQHRWSKEIADKPFYLNYQGAKAEVYWYKRNEMRIVKGAKMLAEPPLNKNGSLGFSARFGLKIREEQAETFSKEFLTTQDVFVKSVNEVGLFLYFAGTNGWLQLKDEAGKTLDEWTVVK